MNFLDALISGAATPKTTYAEDVFSAFTYDGSGGVRSVNNGIDLAANGGLVWIKSTSTTTSYKLTDTARGVQKALSCDTAAAEVTDATGVTAFGANGFTLDSGGSYNASGQKFCAWTFRKAAKFFDIVTYTGNGANRTIAHNLGAVPGMIIVKDVNSTSGWTVYHNALANTDYLRFDGSFAGPATLSGVWNSASATSSVFSLGTSIRTNGSSTNYIAYIFGHDVSASGLVQCGTFTTDGSSKATINLGWEPQYVLLKDLAGNQYFMEFDAARGLSLRTDGLPSSPSFLPSVNGSASVSDTICSPNALGFSVNQYASTQYVYMAIRRPNKPPTVGTEVYNAIARTGTGAVASVTGVGFAPDAVFSQARGTAIGGTWFDRLRGAGNALVPYGTTTENSYGDSLTAFGMDGYLLGADAAQLRINDTGRTYLNWALRRQPGVFDVVCYAGTGIASTKSHSLAVIPELIIVKSRTSGANQWAVYHAALGNSNGVYLNLTNASAAAGFFNNTTPTSTVFSVDAGASNTVNGASQTYVAYLFATKAGISKVGSYTGNGSSQTINAGFTTGARFILIKRTDSTGDWYVWDVTRGIVAGNDPHLSLNTTVAEVATDDSIDPDTTGFIVNQLAATNVNVNAAAYVYLAIA